MLIGTSLNRCMKSILLGEVSADDVLVIVTGTRCEDYDRFKGVLKLYHTDKLKEFELEKLLALGSYLWDTGKIHQPRLSNLGEFYDTHDSIREVTWLEIAPIPDRTSHAVMDAYEKYKLICTLTK